LLKYLQETVNKKYVEIGKNLSAVESLRGGQNSFNLETEKVIEDIPKESWHNEPERSENE